MNVLYQGSLFREGIRDAALCASRLEQRGQ